MDVELPDGSVLTDVPEGTTQTDILQRLYKSGHPAYKQYAIKMMEEKPYGSGVPKLAYDWGGKVTDWTGSPLAGYATNVAVNAVPALLSSFRVGEPVSLAQKPAEALMTNAVKPTQHARLTGKASKAMIDMLRENISPTKGGMDTASEIASKMDAAVENALRGSSAEVPLAPVNEGMLPTYERALTQANPNADVSAVSNAWKEFEGSPLVSNQESIPVQLAHAIKRGTQQSIGSKNYGELGSSATEAQKAIAAQLRKGVAAAVPEVSAPLEREASMMNILDVARDKALLNANKNPLGLAALRIGDNPLSAATFLGDRSAYLKGLLARILYRAGQPQALMPAAVAGTEAVNQTNGMP